MLARSSCQARACFVAVVHLRVAFQLAAAARLQPSADLTDSSLGSYPHSQERLQCVAQQDLDFDILPPAKERAIRLVLAGLPVVKDVHLGIDEIEVNTLSLKVSIGRISDQRFRFDVKGIDSENAQIMAYLDRLKFDMPKSRLDEAVKGVASFEQKTKALLNLFTNVSTDYASLRNIPVAISFSMSGELIAEQVESEKDQWRWKLLPETAKHMADLNFGNGGALTGLANFIVHKYGGIDEVFLNIVWPIVVLLIPPSVGQAFAMIPYAIGDLTQDIQITGKCKDTMTGVADESKPFRCPNQKLDLQVDADAHVKVSAPGIARNLMKTGFASSETGTVFQNLAEAYTKQSFVLLGAHGELQTNFEFAPGRGAVVTVEPRLAIPLEPMKVMLGSEVAEPILNFLPPQGALAISGAFESSSGKIRLPKTRVTNLRIPVSADGESLKIDATLEDFVVELDGGGDSSDPIFDPASPFSLKGRGIQAGVSRQSGLDIGSWMDLHSPKESADIDTAFRVAVDHAMVEEQLGKVAETMLHPANVRSEAPGKADGILPKEFAAPLTHELASLDLVGLVEFLHASTNLKVMTEQVDGLDEGELLKAHFSLRSRTDLQLSSDLWRGLTDNKVPDSGYVFHIAAGAYGEVQKEQTPDRVALAVLSCGFLKIFKFESLSSIGEHLNHDKAWITLDLFEEDDVRVFMKKTLTTKQGLTCIRVKKSRPLARGFTTRHKHICGKAAIQDLQRAINLQLARFRDIPNQMQACEQANAKKAKKEKQQCPGDPDGSWFKDLNPYDPKTYFPGNPHKVDPPVITYGTVVRDSLHVLMDEGCTLVERDGGLGIQACS